MERYARSLFPGLSLLILLSVAGCFATRRMYEGPPLPRDKVGVLYNWSKITTLTILEVDGANLKSKSQSMGRSKGLPGAFVAR